MFVKICSELRKVCTKFTMSGYLEALMWYSEWKSNIYHR